MNIANLPFDITDWQGLEKTIQKGESGFAYWKTKQLGDRRIRMVTYSAGYLAEHWCTKGHILFCVRGELITLLKSGRSFALTAGMSYQVADNGEPHRSSTIEGATLFIVD